MTVHLQPGPHLSPDQLSAFAENALPEHERLAALTHLSACADCRQVVFLTQQADPAFPVSAAAAPTPRRAWFSFSQLIGAATAALACSFILALILHYRHTTAPAAQDLTAKMQVPPAPAQQIPSAQETSIQQQSPPAAPATKSAPLSPATMRPAQIAPAVPAPKPVPMPEPAKLPPSSAHFGYADSGTIGGRSFSEAKQQDKAVLNANGSGSGSASANTFAALPPKNPAGVSGGVPRPMPAPAENRARSTSAGKSEKDFSAGNSSTIASAAAPPPPGASYPQSSAETVEVTADSLSLDTLPRSTGSAVINAAAKSAAAPAVLLPSKLAAVTVLHAAGRTLALDSAGAVFLSRDSGKHWTAVTPQWPGKAAQISLAPSPARLYLQQPSQSQTQTQSGNSVNGLPQQQSPIPTAGFELTTNTGAVFVSTDGLTWRQR